MRSMPRRPPRACDAVYASGVLQLECGVGAWLEAVGRNGVNVIAARRSVWLEVLCARAAHLRSSAADLALGVLGDDALLLLTPRR